MKTVPVPKLLAISLAFIFVIGPAAAGVFDQLEGVVQNKTYTRESAKLSGYTSSALYSPLEPHHAKIDLDRFVDNSIQPKAELATFNLFDKNLWQSIPASGPYCSTCASNNATKTWKSVMLDNYDTAFIKKYKTTTSMFAGGGGAGGAPGGGGCCG